MIAGPYLSTERKINPIVENPFFLATELAEGCKVGDLTVDTARGVVVRVRKSKPNQLGADADVAVPSANTEGQTVWWASAAPMGPRRGAPPHLPPTPSDPSSRSSRQSGCRTCGNVP